MTKKEETSHIKFVGFSSDNVKYKQRPIIQVQKGEVLATYKSIAAAARATGCKFSKIRRVLIGERKTTGGFEWYYA